MDNLFPRLSDQFAIYYFILVQTAKDGVYCLVDEKTGYKVDLCIELRENVLGVYLYCTDFSYDCEEYPLDEGLGFIVSILATKILVVRSILFAEES